MTPPGHVRRAQVKANHEPTEKSLVVRGGHERHGYGGVVLLRQGFRLNRPKDVFSWWLRRHGGPAPQLITSAGKTPGRRHEGTSETGRDRNAAQLIWNCPRSCEFHGALI